MNKLIRILVVDDHALVCEGLEALLRLEKDFSHISSVGSPAEALAAVRSREHHLILLDRRMPESDGFDLITEFRKIAPGVPILMLSASATPREVDCARSLGAAGYLPKTTSRADLLCAIRTILAGGTYFPALDFPGRDGVPALTERQLDVLEHLRRGLGNRDIATALGIGEHTVKAHLKVIFIKLSAANRSEAITRGLELGILSL